MGKRSISAKQLVADIKAGKSDAELMESYNVSAAALQSLFRKLISAGHITQADIDKRIPESERTVNLEVWTCPNCHHPMESKPEECPRCGIIVTKLKKASNEPEFSKTSSANATPANRAEESDMATALSGETGLDTEKVNENYSFISLGNSLVLIGFSLIYCLIIAKENVYTLFLMLGGPTALLIRSFWPPVGFMRGIATFSGGICAVASIVGTYLAFTSYAHSYLTSFIAVALYFFSASALLYIGFRKPNLGDTPSSVPKNVYPALSIDALKQSLYLAKQRQFAAISMVYPVHVILSLALVLIPVMIMGYSPLPQSLKQDIVYHFLKDQTPWKMESVPPYYYYVINSVKIARASKGTVPKAIQERENPVAVYCVQLEAEVLTASIDNEIGYYENWRRDYGELFRYHDTECFCVVIWVAQSGEISATPGEIVPKALSSAKISTYWDNICTFECCK